MSCNVFLCILLLALVVLFAQGFLVTPRSVASNGASSSTLFAHHPQKKIVKRMMDRRPKKHRLSDINRNNVNHNKCINHVENAPPDYRIVSAEEYAKVRDTALLIWEHGDPDAEWHEILPVDMEITIPQNIEPIIGPRPPRRLPLFRSGTR